MLKYADTAVELDKLNVRFVGSHAPKWIEKEHDSETNDRERERRRKNEKCVSV